jgi:Protein of unknown function (DUF2950)
MKLSFMKRYPALSLSGLIIAAALSLAIPNSNAAPPGKTFSSPEDAVHALTTAVNARDTNALTAIFGPSFEDVVSPDPVQAENELTQFAANLNASNHLSHVNANRCVLETGEDSWPFPIPIVRTNGSWFFDTDAGKDEIINRRIGENELFALKAIRAGAEAQREYAAKDHDGDEVREFAQRILSSPGKKDGLYWSPDIDGEISPLGPGFAAAQREGYLKDEQSDEPQPLHGYLFKILTRQGKHAPGGAYDYIINGNMIGGFALVAWPSDYGDTGIMTFIINQQGKVYQKDLGKDTESIVKKMKAYDLDPSWTRSPD